MNHIYRVVWNEALGVWQAVAEFVHGQGKTKSKQLRRVVLAAGLVFAGGAHAAGLPTGGSITAGNGAIHQHGDHLTINQNSGKLAIDWQSFSIGKRNSVTFHQPSASAVALNRVLGPDVSVIQGALNANGQVFLINPNGVLFTPTAQVNVGGLVASTLNLSKEDFLAGNYSFEGDSAGSIVNQGSIVAANGGSIALIAAKVENSGSITAHGGSVLLGSGSKVTLDLGGPVKLEVEEGAIDALIKNGGAIKADGGTVLLTAKAAEDLASTVINNDGIIEAQTLATGERGDIVLLGENGTVEVAGTIDVSAPEGRGGKAVVTGERVLIADGAHIDATGAHGGGEIYVGGGWQGQDPEIKQATATAVMQGAVLDASAIDNGDGGTVVAWSDVSNADSITRVAGTIKATGGANGGDGGRIETSGHGLEVGDAPDVSASAGRGGEWLIDPYNITVVAGNGSTNINGGSPFESSGNSAQLGIDLIDTALSNGSVTIQTGNGGAQGGDIIWDVDYTYTGYSDTSLTLDAHRDIILNKSISSGPHAALSMNFNADSDRNGAGGTVVKKNLDTNGGSLTFDGVGAIFSGESAQQISTAGGSVAFNGEVLLANPDGITISTANGDVTFVGTLNSGNRYTFDGTVETTRKWTDAKAAAEAADGNLDNDGDDIGSTYLATITSALENTAVMAAAGGHQGWIGATDAAKEGTWRWVTGPEGMEDGGQGRILQTSNMSGTGYVGTNGAYINWSANEPNNAGNAEHYGQIGYSSSGQWNDLLNVVDDDRDIGAIVETNLANSSLTINAGSGTVTFRDKVGTNKALGSLNINGTGAVSLQTGTIVSSGTIDIDPSVQLDAGPGTTYNISGAEIAWNSDVDYNGIGVGSTLVLDASGNIQVDGAIADSASDDDALSLVLNAGGKVDVYGVLRSGAGGNIDIAAHGAVYVTGSIAAAGAGNVEVYSATGGVQLNSGTVQVADGDLTIDAHANLNPINNSWIRSTGAGDINLISRTTSIHIGGTYYGGGVEAAGTGNVSLVATDLGNSHGALRGNNELQVMTYDADGSIIVGGAKNTGDGKLNVSSEWLGLMRNGGFDHVIIGRTDGAGAVNVKTASFNQDVTIQSGGNVSIDGALGVGGNTLTLAADSGVTQTGSVTAGSLLLSGSGNYALSGSNNVGILAADVDGALSFVDANALTVGSVNGINGITAAGTIDIATRTGDLTVAQAVATSDTSAEALVLNAGRNTAAGTKTGGDLILNATLATGAEGRATLYTGSLDGSTGVVAAAGGSGSGNFRYGSDEATTKYDTDTASLGTGTYVIYREQPTLAIAVGSAKSQYGDAPDVSDVTHTTTGYVNGDTGGLSGTATFTTDASATSNVGTYDIAYAGGLSNALGYAIADADTQTGEYTVVQRVLNLSGERVYDGSTDLAAEIFTLDNLANGDTLVLTGNGTMADKHAGDDKTVTLGTLALANGSDGDLASNYTLAGGTHTVDVSKRAVTVSGITADDKIYDGNADATVTIDGVSFANIVSGDELTVSSTGAFVDKNADTDKTVNLTNTYGGVDLDNYVITDQATTTADIARKAVTVSGSFTVDNKIYDGETAAAITSNSLSLSGILAGETLDVTGFVAAFADKNVANGIAVNLANATLVDGTGDASNYTLDLTGAPTTTANIAPKSLVVSGAFTAGDKVYDGTTVAVIDTSGLTLSGLVTGEDLNLDGFSGSFGDRNAGQDITVTLDNAGIADGVTGSASNYTLTLAGAPTTTADILRRAVTVTANEQSKMQGTADPALTYSAEAQSAGRGLLTGESLFGAPVREGGDGIGEYLISQGTLIDANNPNYVISFVDGVFQIIPATEVETAQHVAQILPHVITNSHNIAPQGDLASFDGADNAQGTGSPDSQAATLRFVELSASEDAEGGAGLGGAADTGDDVASDDKIDMASRSDYGPLRVFVVQGGIKLPIFDASRANPPAAAE